jgi:hypothetical protein
MPSRSSARPIASPIEPHSCNADARVIPPGDQPREEIELTIGTTQGRWIQDAFDLRGAPKQRTSATRARASGPRQMAECGGRSAR